MPRRKAPTVQLEKVSIRMYRPGLGDCFLVTFRGKRGLLPVERHLLVDCGVLRGTADESERLRKVILDIHQRTGGKLDVLAVTHEHADHLSGFNYHQDLFSREFEIGQVWLAWTEDKDDPQVKEMYSAVRKIPLQVLEYALEELKKANSPNYPYYKQLADFLKDNGMEAVKAIASAHRLQPLYLGPDPDAQGPSRVIEWLDFGGVRFHVLGPPTDPALLTRSDPPKTRNQIDRGAALNLATAFSAAVLHQAASFSISLGDLSAEDVQELYDLSLPFDPIQGMTLASLQAPPGEGLSPAQAEARAFILENYFSQGKAEDDNWRRIDADWLEAAGALALYLDGDLNNTSLVLAIELGAGGKVLLFPGDAQYGNWLSWATTPRGKDLLERTVFYKVGHHGSHNATLKQEGLSRMATAPGFEELTAMIPVDTEKAKTRRGWVMPEPDLKEMLIRQAQGRVILACEGTEVGQNCDEFGYQKPRRPPAGVRLSPVEWRRYLSAIKADEGEDYLWVEYTLTV